MSSKKGFKTSIGGQAVIEGVMMRGPEKSAMAVRLPGGAIDIEEWEASASRKWSRKTPFIRGVFNMADSMFLGYKCLMKSAEKAGLEEGQPSRFEKWLSGRLGKSLMTVTSAIALLLGVALSVGLFMILPTFLVSMAGRLLSQPIAPIAKSLFEGIIKIAVFVLYLLLISRMPDVRRVFEYHGAEHKTIACYEAGKELTPESVRAMPRFHPRCGTSFMLIVLVISILLFSALTWNNAVLRVALKLALLPAVVSISYELIKYAGRHDNPLTRAISAPGLWFQRLTTYEPDDSQIEVAIASMLPVIPKEKGSDQW